MLSILSAIHTLIQWFTSHFHFAEKMDIRVLNAECHGKTLLVSFKRGVILLAVGAKAVLSPVARTNFVKSARAVWHREQSFSLSFIFFCELRIDRHWRKSRSSSWNNSDPLELTAGNTRCIITFAYVLVLETGLKVTKWLTVRSRDRLRS
jgi:hypothetical protein